MLCGVNKVGEQCAKLSAKGVDSLDLFVSAGKNENTRLVVSGEFVHETCRKRVLRNRKEPSVCNDVQDENFCEQLHFVRQILPKTSFSFKDNCFFCNTVIFFDSLQKHSLKNEICYVKSDDLDMKLKKKSEQRCDKWGATVFDRILEVTHLQEAGAIYQNSALIILKIAYNETYCVTKGNSK